MIKGTVLMDQAKGPKRKRFRVVVQQRTIGPDDAALFLLPSVRMFAPTGPVIRQLRSQSQVNAKISSLSSVFDPHIPQTSFLEGAQNIVLPTVGHFRPLADPRSLSVLDEILSSTREWGHHVRLM